MGNCQAIDAAALVIQHPNGRIDRTYWPVTVSEVMKMNPGHYVSLIIPINDGDDVHADADNSNDNNKTIRFTRVKLLRPTDTLVLGRAYRLVTTQEVMKVLRAKKHAKMMKAHAESDEKYPGEAGKSQLDNDSQGRRHERNKQRTGIGSRSSSVVARSKSWRPSLDSISETGSKLMVM